METPRTSNLRRQRWRLKIASLKLLIEIQSLQVAQSRDVEAQCPSPSLALSVSSFYLVVLRCILHRNPTTGTRLSRTVRGLPVPQILNLWVATL